MKNKPVETSGPPGVSNQKPTVSQTDRVEKLRASLSICCQMLNRKSIKTTEVKINTHFAAELYLNEGDFLVDILVMLC